MFKTHLGKILVLFLSVSLVATFHAELLFNPNTRLLGDAKDGFKNYYTLIYHIKHDSTYSHFAGMNHPYGEHVVFTDNQPLLSNSLKFISDNLVDISDYTVGILNILMLLSIVVTCYILYLLFRRFKIPDLWSVLFAIGVGCMAPQVHRMGGHYALAYGFIIPLIMLLWIRFREKPLLKNSVILGGVVLAASLLHIYYFALSAFFLTGYWVLSNIIQHRKKYFSISLKHLFLQVILPFMMLQLWFYLTDDVTDRPGNPSGFLTYRSHWQEIFLPMLYPLGSSIRTIIEFPRPEFEGIAYIGLIPGLIWIRYVILWLFNFVSSKGKTIKTISSDTDLNYLFLISFCILLFALGYPFKLNLEFLVDYLGPLKQFRSIGRFSWVFFYAANLAGFVILYNIVDTLQVRKGVKTMLLSISVVFLLYEANMFHNHRPFYKLSEAPALRIDNGRANNNAILHIKSENFQAILPLPYYHSGSENIIVRAKGKIVKHTMVASILSGLPLCAVNMSRTSLSQTVNNFRLILEPYGPYEVMKSYKSPKPLLLWVEKHEALRKNEKVLIENSKILYEDDDIALAALEIQTFYDLLNNQYKRAILEAKDTTLYQVSAFLTRDSLLNFYHEYSIDENGKVSTWMTKPSEGNVREKNVIFESTLPLQDTVSYTMSLWVKFLEDRHPKARLLFDELNEKGDTVFSSTWSFGDLVTLVDYDWALIEYEFKPHGRENNLYLTINRDIESGWTVYWNDLLIRPSDNDIYYVRDEDLVFKNGRMYGPDFFTKPID